MSDGGDEQECRTEVDALTASLDERASVNKPSHGDFVLGPFVAFRLLAQERRFLVCAGGHVQ